MLKSTWSLALILIIVLLSKAVPVAAVTPTQELQQGSFDLFGFKPLDLVPSGSPQVTQLANSTYVVQSGKYVLIGWNDLGMHCISPRFKEMAILPPYNTIRAIVIKKGGEEPHVVTSGITVKYSLDNNTTVKGKSDFWTYAQKLFGKTLPLGIGLTGNGLSGTMAKKSGYFEATGIPALPFNDKMQWDPYQHATLTMTGTGISGKTLVVVPVSDEMNCQKCHNSGGVAAKGIATPTLEGNILTLHDKREGTKLMNNRPVLCASCHADAALGAVGKTGIPSLSYVMHVKHNAIAKKPLCIDCHPGVKTQCNRSAIEDMGPEGTNPKCENCHGGMEKMASALKAGRRPWVDEPTCAQCHGQKYSTGKLLYREAKGHGGVFCVACHNSPHAWLPSKRADDNLQAMGLQGNNHALGYNACNLCHTDGRRGTVPPHGDDEEEDD